MPNPSPTPLFDMSKAVPIPGAQPSAATPLFDMSKAVPITGYQGPTTGTGIAVPQGMSTGREAWDSMKKTAGDLATGAAQGTARTVGSSVTGIARLLRSAMNTFEPGAGEALIPEEGINSLDARTQQASSSANTAQQVGKVGEQIGEFLLPGPGEEDAVAHALPWLSKLGRAAKPVARIGYQAGTQALVNGAQGGSPMTGAITGAVGGGIGEGLRAVAPALAESALGVTKKMRGYGKAPGLAALEETTGLMPTTVEQSAQTKLGQLTKGIESSAQAHPGTVSLQPAIDTIDDEISKATSQNNAGAVEQLGRVRKALTESVATGGPLPVDQPAAGALNIKRGLRNQFVKNWNPEFMEGTRAAAAHASGAIDSELDNALGPEFSEANQRISSLVPVADRSESLARDPSLMQRAGNRIAAHTGALAGSAALGYGGYQRGGIKGALGGALTGLVLPEVLASPQMKMLAARAAFSPSALVKLLGGGALQFDRSSDQQPE